MMYFSPRKLLLSHNATATLLVKTIVTCPCYILCAPNCTIAQLDGTDRFRPPSPPPPLSATQKSNNMSMLLILMLSILGAAFLCLCYFTIMKRYRSNLTTSRRVFLSIFSDANGEGFSDENHGRILDHPIWYIQTVGLQDSVIDSISVFKYKKGDGLVEGSDCSVCLTEFEDDESLRLLPKCSHAFHLPCIDTWLRSHKNCPLCRAPIVRDEVGVVVVDPLPESEDALVDDDEQVNDGNGELRNEGERIRPLSDGQEKTVRVRVLSDLGDRRVRTGEDQLQAVRRSFSMDLPSASRIYGVNNGEVGKIQPIYEEGSSSVDDHQVEGLKKPNSSVNRSSSRKSFSFGRSLQSVPIRMKRSFSSSSGKSSVSRSQELV